MRPSTFYEPAWVSRWDRLLRDLRHERPRFSMSDLQEAGEEAPRDRERRGRSSRLDSLHW